MRSDDRAAWLAGWALVWLAAVPLAAAERESVALVQSGALAPFVTAADAVAERLRNARPGLDLARFDLAGDEGNGAKVLRALRARPPRVVVTVGSLATGVVLDGLVGAPLVFSMVLYPREGGYLGRAGSDVTGVSLDVPLGQQFDYLRRLLPRARTIGVLYSPDESGHIVEAARGAARDAGFQLDAERVDQPANAAKLLRQLATRVDVVWSVADGHVFTPSTTAGLILTALRNQVPLIGLSPAHVRAGALAAPACDYADIGAQAAELALRVLGGEPAAAIPPATPRRIRWALNLRTAEHLGLQVPEALRAEAAETVR